MASKRPLPLVRQPDEATDPFRWVLATFDEHSYTLARHFDGEAFFRLAGDAGHGWMPKAQAQALADRLNTEMDAKRAKEPVMASARLKPSTKPKKPDLVGPTWWCPVEGTTEGHPLAERHVDNGRILYVPVARAQHWCVEGGPNKYGYARPLDGGFYAFVRPAKQPRQGPEAWLLKLDMGIQPRVAAGPFRNRVPNAAVIKELRGKPFDEDDLYFTATLKDGRLAVQAYSNAQMEALHHEAITGRKGP